jgi:hypothetical protein
MPIWHQRINARRENAFRRPDGPPTPPCPWHRVARPGTGGARRYHHMTSIEQSLRPGDRRVFCQPIDTSLGSSDDGSLAGCSTRTIPMPSYWFRFGVTQYTQGGYIIYVGRLYYIS